VEGYRHHAAAASTPDPPILPVGISTLHCLALLLLLLHLLLQGD
jgi:hypothetical protein